MGLTPFVLSAALLFACAQKSGGARQVAAGREFQLRAGQSASLKGAGVKVRFASVAEDSRCPLNVQCVWAGNAKVAVVLQRGGGRPTTVELNTNLEPKAVSWMNYEISLTKLSPHPQSDAKINPKQYTATLVVRRK